MCRICRNNYIAICSNWNSLQNTKNTCYKRTACFLSQQRQIFCVQKGMFICMKMCIFYPFFHSQIFWSNMPFSTNFHINPLTPRIHDRVDWKNGLRSSPGLYFLSVRAWSTRSWAPPHICLSQRAQLTTQVSWCLPSMEGTRSVWVKIFKYMCM